MRAVARGSLGRATAEETAYALLALRALHQALPFYQTERAAMAAAQGRRQLFCWFEPVSLAEPHSSLGASLGHCQHSRWEQKCVCARSRRSSGDAGGVFGRGGHDMKLGTRAENPLEWAVLQSGLVPTALLDTIIALLLSRAIMVGTRLGLFEALSAGPLTQRGGSGPVRPASRSGGEVAGSASRSRLSGLRGWRLPFGAFGPQMAAQGEPAFALRCGSHAISRRDLHRADGVICAHW